MFSLTCREHCPRCDRTCVCIYTSHTVKSLPVRRKRTGNLSKSYYHDYLSYNKCEICLLEALYNKECGNLSTGSFVFNVIIVNRSCYNHTQLKRSSYSVNQASSKFVEVFVKQKETTLSRFRPGVDVC